jgi:hypothetical protein
MTHAFAKPVVFASDVQLSAASLRALQRTGDRALELLAETTPLRRRLTQPDDDSLALLNLIDCVTDELLRTGAAERALGRDYVHSEVRALLLCEDVLAGEVVAEAVSPVRDLIRMRRDARHLRWLRRAKAQFDATLRAPDTRGLTLRMHEELTRTSSARVASERYRAADHAFGGQEILWRLTDTPETERIALPADAGFAALAGDPAQASPAFTRNLATAVRSTARHLYGIPVASLQGQGLTAHPDESSSEAIAATRYVLLATPGDPPRALDDLALLKYRNPFAPGAPATDLPLGFTATIRNTARNLI